MIVNKGGRGVYELIITFLDIQMEEGDKEVKNGIWATCTPHNHIITMTLALNLTRKDR